MAEQFDPRSAAPAPTESSRFTAIGAQPDQPVAERHLSPQECTAIDALPAGSALLIALSGPNSGARFLLDGEVTNAGRSPRADIFLDDVTVSRKHVQFFRRGDTFHVRDSGSLNGTYVNRERVDDAALRTGDEIQIGKFRLPFYASRAGA